MLTVCRVSLNSNFHIQIENNMRMVEFSYSYYHISCVIKEYFHVFNFNILASFITNVQCLFGIIRGSCLCMFSDYYECCNCCQILNQRGEHCHLVYEMTMFSPACNLKKRETLDDSLFPCLEEVVNVQIDLLHIEFLPQKMIVNNILKANREQQHNPHLYIYIYRERYFLMSSNQRVTVEN